MYTNVRWCTLKPDGKERMMRGLRFRTPLILTGWAVAMLAMAYVLLAIASDSAWILATPKQATIFILGTAVLCFSYAMMLENSERL